MKKVIIFILSCCITSVVFANEVPRGLATDKRVKVVAFDPDNIVTIEGSHLVSTAVYFDKNERILHVDVGDPIAWKISLTPDAPEALFLCPQLPQSDTNMTVITDKHIYQFRLLTNPNEMPSSNNVTYALEFKYPDEEKADLQQQVLGLQKTFMGNVGSDPVEWNYGYSFYGAKDIAPIQAVDNGTFTIFKFAKNSPIPAIFAVDRHRNESLLNFRVQGDYVFVQGIRHQYTLRNGEDVTTVYNDNYQG